MPRAISSMSLSLSDASKERMRSAKACAASDAGFGEGEGEGVGDGCALGTAAISGRAAAAVKNDLRVDKDDQTSITTGTITGRRR